MMLRKRVPLRESIATSALVLARKNWRTVILPVVSRSPSLSTGFTAQSVNQPAMNTQEDEGGGGSIKMIIICVILIVTNRDPCHFSLGSRGRRGVLETNTPRGWNWCSWEQYTLHTQQSSQGNTVQSVLIFMHLKYNPLRNVTVVIRQLNMFSRVAVKCLFVGVLSPVNH